MCIGAATGHLRGYTLTEFTHVSAHADTTACVARSRGQRCRGGLSSFVHTGITFKLAEMDSICLNMLCDLLRVEFLVGHVQGHRS